KPDLRRRPLAPGHARLINRMLAQDVPTAHHQVAEQITAGTLRQVAVDRTVGDIVWRLRPRLRRERRRGGAAEDEDVAVAHARVEFQAGGACRQTAYLNRSAQRMADRLDERLAVGT